MCQIKDKNGNKVQRKDIDEIKVIFTDLDGTLLNSQNGISDMNLEILAKAKNRGLNVVVSTGRSLLSVERVIGERIKKSNLSFFPGIYLNGSITFNSDGSLIVDKFIENNLKMEVIDFAKSLDILQYCTCYSLNKTYCFFMNDQIHYVSKIEHVVPELIKEEEIKNINIYKILFCLNNNMKDILKIYQNKFSNKINIANTFESCIEIFHLDVNKMESIKKICKLYNISLNNVLAIGDGENDMEMLSGIPNSVAVSNASEKVKNCAKYVGPSNNDNAVAHVIQAFCNI